MRPIIKNIFHVKEIVLNDGRREALIKITDGVFQICRYNVSNEGAYTAADWAFLERVAEEIRLNNNCLEETE